MIILKIANMGEIKIELDYKNAPISSANFVSLVNKGFYDGLTFHRIIKGFMIQGGCPLGNGTGGPGYSIKGEFRSNGVNNQLSHKRGVISMARAMNPNSAGSQFFICDKDDLFLDGQYAAFGHVIEGMDVVDKIASVKTGYQDKPLNKVVIEKALSVEEPEPEFEKID
jgi:Peptidyl-prolyl cis-trans isomerase (rotamase) - cyclophilin family